jgi:K+-transporting ATPase ATPase C chain
MSSVIRPAVSLLALLTVVTGVAYPLVVTGVAQAVFPDQANGSLVVKDGKTTGSRLIGQSFDDVKYFWGRPSATGPVPYNAAASTGSNLSPTNQALVDTISGRIAALEAAHPSSPKIKIPVDLVTASGSGLDPHISPAAAFYQVERVAKARGLPEERVRTLVMNQIEGRDLGMFGEPRVNVVLLNLALDDLARGTS